MWKIENVDELSDFIQTLKIRDQIDFEKVEFDFLKQVKIKIQGDPLRYNGSINYAICKAICEFQNEIWRTYAEIKTGKPHITQLTQEEKDALEITFTINEGCTEIFTYTTLAICIGGAVVGMKWVESQKDIELAQIQLTEKQATENIEAQKLTTILTTIKDVANHSTNSRFKQSIQSIEEHTEKAYSEVVRAASDAENITISSNNAETKLDKQQITKIVDELNSQEKAKTTPDAIDLYIDGVKRQEGKITIFARTLQGETFTANIDSDMLGDEGVNEIIDRVKDINTIKLSGMVKRRAGKIEQATFSTIIVEE